jgi:hypothetical protein
MALIRTILAALIAISVAAVPATTEAIVAPSLAEVMLTDQADMPCCPPSDAQGNFKATACVLKCAALAGTIVPATALVLPRMANGSWLSLVDNTLRELLRAPPTHPPPA